MPTAHDRRVTARGLSFHYVEWGAPTAPPLLCLHGITQTAHSWDEVAAELSSAHRVLCFDQRGHGDSDWAPDGDYSRQTQAADLDAITDALGLIAVHPRRHVDGRHQRHHLHARAIRRRCEALIIVDVSPEIQVKGVENIRSFIQAADELDSFEAFVERAHQFNPRRSLDNIRSRLSHNLKQLPNGKWTWKYDKALRSPERGFQASALVQSLGRRARHPLPDADHQRRRERHSVRRERRQAAGGDSRQPRRGGPRRRPLGHGRQSGGVCGGGAGVS